MTTNTNSIFLTHTRLLVAISSLLLSIILIATDDIINKDGILYIHTASAFLSGGISASFELFNWPFYSILIAIVHQLTGLPLEMSAYVLTTFFFILLTDSLYLICRKILPSPQHVLVGMIIFLAFYSLNDYRNFIIRDPGYWAFSSLGLFFFMSFLDNGQWRTTFYWQLSMIGAILFRVEATFLLLALPLYALFHFPFTHSKVSHYLQLTSLPLLALIALPFSSYFRSILGDSDRLNSLMYRDVPELLHHFSNKADQIIQLLPSFTHDHGSLILFTGLLGFIVFLIIEAIHIGYFGLYIAARWQKPSPNFPHRQLLIYTLILNMLVLVGFTFMQFFMITRYCIMLTLILLLLMLPAITNFLVAAWQNKNHKILLSFVVIILLSLYVSLSYSISKRYIKETALWASEHLPKNSHTATDSPFIAYYFNTRSDRRPIELVTTLENASAYDQLLYVEKIKNMLSETKLIAIQSRQTIYSMQNQRGDKSSVYE